MEKIIRIIDEIPYEHNGKQIIGKTQKEFYKKCLTYRYEKVLKPTYTKVKENEILEQQKAEAQNIEETTEPVRHRRR